MKRTHYPSVTFALVEGQDDKGFVERHTNCHGIIAHGRPNVLAAVDILGRHPSFPGVLGIVDADFSRLEGQVAFGPNILVTDFHDMEVALLVSPALYHVLNEIGDVERISTFVRHIGYSVCAVM